MSTEPTPEQKKDLSERLKRFQEKSLKVDSRNPSIFLRRLLEKKAFDLSQLENFEELKENILLQLLKGKKSLCILKSSDVSEKALANSGKLKSLYRTTKLIRDETGQDALFLGFPLIEGHLHDNYSYTRAPLILFPIQLEFERTKKPAGWYVYIDQERIPKTRKATTIRLVQVAEFFIETKKLGQIIL